MKGIQYFDSVVNLLRTESNPSVCWHLLLRLTGQSLKDRFNGLDVQGDIHGIAEQLNRIWAFEPIPEGTTFLYFGLYDVLEKGAADEGAGFYISGGYGSDPKEQLEDGNLPYFPTHRRIHSDILEQIRVTENEYPDEADVLNYALMLGAAAILAREAVASLKVSLPVYAGFDSGDFLLASGAWWLANIAITLIVRSMSAIAC